MMDVRRRFCRAIAGVVTVIVFVFPAASSKAGSYRAPAPNADVDMIVVNMNDDSDYKLTSAAEGVLFDLDCDGKDEKAAWTEAGSGVALLAMDRNGDGQIVSGRELFGRQTLPGVSDGFAALRRMAMETNGGVPRGSVSSDDPLFARLLLWRDSNHNGRSESAELTPLSAVVSDIGLGYRLLPRRDGHGNEFRYRGWVHIRTAPGRNKVQSSAENDERTRSIWDVFLVTQR